MLNLNLLLLAGLIAIAVEWLGLLGGVHGNEVLIFATSALAIIPLAGLIGQATEELASRLGTQISGLLNATLGNAAELIITIFALRAGLTELVKASIVGSILGNLLLVAGFSLLLGGLKQGRQIFNQRQAGMNATLVVLAFLALAIPSLFDAALVEVNALQSELLFSEGVAIILIVLYGLSLLYALRDPENRTASHSGAHVPQWSVSQAVAVLAAATLGIVIMSEFLVRSVEPVVAQLGWTEFFVGIIIVPIVGNVAEHLVAVQVAMKNQMDLSLNISLGSSLQIALFVAPVLVFVSLLFQNKLLLVFNPYELIALSAASFIAALVALDGESNWLEGAMLLAVYLILALAFFVLPGSAPAAL
ncbi:MAG: calcium/proton exchanger [Anaerolineae bacterium]|nr:calcium/proton exchanger [Anaerolineae bacterium]